MKIDIVTIFPEYFAPLDISLLGKARRAGLLDVHVHDLRTWTHDRHRTVDDTPYGGGPGMVMKPEPWGEALDALVPPPPANDAPTPPNGPPPTGTHPPIERSAEVKSTGRIPSSRGSAAPGGAPTDEGAPGGGGLLPGSAGAPSSGESMPAESPAPGAAGAVPRLIIPTPSGRPFTQADAVRYAAEPWLVFACGRYEGIDSRVVEEARTRMPVDEVSLGDFVLAGGEVAVMVMVEAIARLVPGVLGNAQSVTDDSFAPGAMESLLEGPVYTKPPVWRDRPVPDVLLSGHHGAIARWRRDEALRRTARHRPELLARLAPEDLDKRDRAVLREAGFPVDGEDMAD
ncbi:tRNA (guanine-N1)-methyltransferase [Mycobacterium tuberculosis]|nr:tRNA (guanine-N1)-methyltransferase [Mycobacterium tuberculosis]